MRAAGRGDLQAMRRLLAAGTNVDELTGDDPGSIFYFGGRSALSVAAASGQTAAVRLLLEAGATSDRVSDDGETPLIEAAHGGSAPTVKLLLARGAKLRPRGARSTLLYAAAYHGQLAIAKLAVAHGARIDEALADGDTPLITAAKYAHPTLVAFLLARGASVNRKNNAGNTALHELAGSSPAEINALLRHDPDVIARIVKVAKLLIAAGANARARDREGLAAIDIAARRYHDWLDLTRLLLEAGARPAAATFAEARKAGSLLVAGCLIDAGFARPEALGRGKLQLPSSARRTTDRAMELYRSARYRQALAAYRWIPACVRERVPEIASNMAYCFQRTGNHREALRHFELAYSQAPRMKHIPAAACYSASELARWPEMLGFATRATKLAPKSDYAWQQLAIARSGLGDHAGAVTAGKKALALNPENGYALCNLATDLHALGDPEWRSALSRGLALEPGLRGEMAKLVKASRSRRR